MNVRHDFRFPPMRLSRRDLAKLAARAAAMDAQAEEEVRAEDMQWATESMPPDQREEYVEVRARGRYRSPRVMVVTKHGKVDGDDFEDVLANAAPDGITAIIIRGRSPYLETTVNLPVGRSYLVDRPEVEIEADNRERVNTEVGFYRDFVRSRAVAWRRVTGNLWVQLALSFGPVAVAYALGLIFRDSPDEPVRIPIWALAPFVFGPLLAALLARISPSLEIEGISPPSWIGQNINGIVVGLISSAFVTGMIWLIASILANP